MSSPAPPRVRPAPEPDDPVLFDTPSASPRHRHVREPPSPLLVAGLALGITVLLALGAAALGAAAGMVAWWVLAG